MSNETHNGSDDTPEAIDPSSEAIVEREGLMSVRETLRGRRILLTGSTGFLGKVYASMLLTKHPDIEQLYLVIRPRTHESAFDRFHRELVACGAFDPLRDIYGPGLDDFLAEKVTVLAGDITDENLGLPTDEAKAISATLDVVVNSAGLTNFNPNLENALEVNTLSARRMMDFIRLGGGRARLLHVSTAFVAGITSDPTPEELPTPERYPARDDLEVEFDPIREVKDCQRLIQHVKELAEDQERQTHFTAEARSALRDANRNPDDPDLLEDARGQARWQWVKRRLSDEGRERASHWGWVNIYTYTKSLGERLIVTEGEDLEYSLFRPAVIESAESFPQVGWNEGINTTAPITYLSYKGHRFIPTHERASLDIIPVDMTVGSMLAITAALIRKCAHDVYHLGSSDRNKLHMPRIVELTTLGTRQLIDKDTHRSVVGKTVLKSLDSVPVSQKTFDRQSLPGFARAARGLKRLIDRAPTDTMGGLGKALEGVQKSAGRIERMASTGAKIFEIFKPFIYDNEYTFIARNIEDLATRLVPEERELYGCPIADLDWREYWLEIHIPGLRKNAYPALEAKLSEATGDTWTYESLVDLFQSSTTNYADRVAMQHYDGGIVERYTYDELRQHAAAGSRAFSARGIGKGHAVMLVSENRPQWGMAYFAILDAGATAVPVDPESSVEQVVNIARSSKAAAIVVSDEVLDRFGERLSKQLDALDHDPHIITFASLFALQLSADEEADTGADQLPTLFGPSTPEEVASLIFTSGTTGDPKGVMLSHKNFSSLLRSLDGTFDIDESDGFLSVLPLHHTFEFTSGFLLPISRGSTITYLAELSGDELRAAMKSSRITAMIGVPALWQLLHRRIEQNVSSGPAWRKWLFDRMVDLNRFLRQRFDVNLGPMLFGPVHQAFGGKIRYLVSGGSALPGEILESFYGLGFDMYEGYGLTEAAPVLTVNRPKGGLAAGSVGRPLRGIDVEIRDADDDGVGEVVARGDNVMLGYLDRPEETERVLDDGWLRTGDLGKIDRKGRLTIVGRSKETIVTAAGKNVYPDELEEIYGTCPHVLELSVVGLPDGQGNERVACLVRVDLPDDASPEAVAEKRQAVREWIRIEGARVASHNRIQVLKFWDQELPRTATRKVKRTEVVEIMQRLMQTDVDEDAAVDDSWLARTVTQLAGVDPGELTPQSHFADDLAFDSLMTVELASILAEHDVHLTPEQLATIDTFEELEHAVEHGVALGAMVRQNHSAIQRVDELPVPAPVARMGKQWLHRAQMRAYRDLFDVDVFGQANIPYHNPNVIVVANHASHLDMGLAKYALGDFGTGIRALAAADYFFSNTARKTYFKNFTNLIPVERSGSPEVALKGAVDALQRGETLLMFPEGTRATGGKLREFKRGLGYLVERQQVDILPLHIAGTHEALPKGRPLPHPTRRNLRVRIGHLLSARDILDDAAERDLSGGELWDFVSAQAYDAVATLQQVGQPLQNEPLEPLFEELSGKFERDQVDETVSYYFSLGNVDEQKWTVVIEAESCVIKRGKPAGGLADCVVKTSPEVFRRIVQESYIPSFDEFMNGTIKTNSPDLLMRFQSVFGLQR